MQLKPSALRTLREAMIHRGSRPSLPVPGELASSDTRDSSLELAAIVERVSPICEALYLLMVEDGKCEQAEFELLRGAARALTDGQLHTGTLEQMLKRFSESRAREGRKARLARVAAHLAADRADAEATYLLAAAMSMADGVFDTREGALLDELQELVGIPTGRAQVLVGEAR